MLKLLLCGTDHVDAEVELLLHAAVAGGHVDMLLLPHSAWGDWALVSIMASDKHRMDNWTHLRIKIKALCCMLNGCLNMVSRHEIGQQAA